MLSHGPWVSGSVDLCRQGCDFKARLTLVYVETRPIYGAKLSQNAIFSGTWCIFKKLLPGPLFVKPHLNGLIGEENPSFKSVEGSNGNLLPLFRRTDKNIEQWAANTQTKSCAALICCWLTVFYCISLIHYSLWPQATTKGLFTNYLSWNSRFDHNGLSVKNFWCFYEVLPGLQILSN